MNRLRIILLLAAVASWGKLFAWDKNAIDEFVARVMKTHAVSFIVELIPPENGKDVFELESKNGKIVLRGNNGVSIGSALNYYLKNYCHCLITWNGTNMNLPGVLPAVSNKVRKTSPYRYRYYLNYCTFNYSMAWWDWNRWQQEIDWMTLNGINMPLALTGEESVWNRVYKSMGFSQSQLDSFFCGPSYFAWFWMGNLDVWGGPLTQSWMNNREKLQKKILAAERAMGMTPVLPAFTGHVPPSFNRKFPSAKVKKTNWRSGFDDVLILDPADPMFETIGQKFLAEQAKAYGTDHYYSADTFNENIPPAEDSAYLNDIGKRIFASMAATDPQAIWVMQGWMFHYDSAFWKPQQMQALLHSVPDDHMIILDLYSESFPVWKKTNAYYGKPWIWNMLHNFGGNLSLWGRMDNAANDPSSALNSNASGKMAGIGLTPEAIEQNPALYQLMLENVWQDQPVIIPDWLQQYTLNRYGVYNKEVNEAWQILANTVYKGSLTEGGPESIITGRPTLDSSTKWTRTRLDYDSYELVRAWDIFIKASSALSSSEGYRYDLVDITRQVLANYAGVIHQQMAKAYREKDSAAFRYHAQKFIELIDDMDRLLCTRNDFLLGKWIGDARKNGATPQEKDQYERNARNLITLWGDKESPLHDYSCRQWAGLLKGFYKPRWQYFFNYLDYSLRLNQTADWNKINAGLKDWEWKWVNQHEKHSDRAYGDEIVVSKLLYQKYRRAIGAAK